MKSAVLFEFALVYPHENDKSNKDMSNEICSTV
jgi:hypothetical protein